MKIWAGRVSCEEEKMNMWRVLVGNRNERVKSEDSGAKRTTIK